MTKLREKLKTDASAALSLLSLTLMTVFFLAVYIYM